MYDTLEALTRRPALFEDWDTAALWADPHVSERMLALHLDDESALASRTFAEIEAMAAWINRAISLDGKDVLDLGCGPGLYAARFQSHGARVIGMDLSERSVKYARESGVPGARFVHGSYHDTPLLTCDVATLIYGDVCAMPRASRIALFRRVRQSLRDGGAFVLDAFTPALLQDREETFVCARDLDDGFWAPSPYFGFKQTFLYPDEASILDRYLIVEPDRTRTVNTWLQALTPDQLLAELDEAGLAAEPPKDVATGLDWDERSPMFALIARPA